MNRRTALLGLACGGVGALAGHLATPKGQTCNLKGTPLDELHTYVCAFHVAKDNPALQMEAHHYCMPVREGVFQCVVLNDNKMPAKILGIEYIIVDDIYQTLSEKEKSFWHPHNYEITSGLLIAPNLNIEEENKLMKSLMKSWGKTIHTWPDPKSDLPLGDPILMWSFDKDGQVNPELVKIRDEKMKVQTEGIRLRRIKNGIK